MNEISIDSAAQAVDCMGDHLDTIETARNGDVSVPLPSEMKSFGMLSITSRHPWCDLLLPWILPPEILELQRQADAGSAIKVEFEEIEKT